MIATETVPALKMSAGPERRPVLDKFRCGRFRFVLQATTSLRLNEFAGSTLRGGFGHVFKKIVCSWPPGDCRRCLLSNICAYSYVFETAPPPSSEKLRGLDQIPRPYVIEPPVASGHGPHAFRPGEHLAFHLVLIGRAVALLPHFVLTFQELGRVGLGPGRGKFQLKAVEALGHDGCQQVYWGDSETFSQPKDAVTSDTLVKRFPLATRWLRVHFLTPTRIRNDGIVCSDLTFQDLVRALLRRLSSLCYFHCGGELDVDFKELIEQAATVRTIASDLRWQDQERFSGRQHQRIDMGGIVGSVTFQAPDAETLAPYLPLLAAGEFVHVGKGAVMGLGTYRIDIP